MYGDVIIFAGCAGQLMMQGPLILAYDIDLRDDGVWQVAHILGLCSFIFTTYKCLYSLEDRDVVIAWMLCSL
jgi:hypothetical protein